jgi:hypothetical protein
MKPQVFKYLLTTERNGHGQERFHAEFVRPWYFGGNVSILCHRWPTWYNKNQLMEAIKRDADERRTRHLNEYKVVIVEPIEL